MTATVHGGPSFQGDWAGIAFRTAVDSPSYYTHSVASSNMKKSHSYTDWHNVDEDMATIAYHGGSWVVNNQGGIAYRDTDDYPSSSTNLVASHVCKHHLLHLDGYHNVGYKIPTDQSIHMYPYLYKFS